MSAEAQARAEAGAIPVSLTVDGAAMRAVNAVADAVLLVALLGELGVVALNVISRSVFDTGFLWTDEIAKLALSTLAFIGGAAAYGRGHHTAVRTLLNALPAGARRHCDAAAEFLVLLLALVIGGNSVMLLETRWTELTPILEMPASWIAAPLTASMALLAVHAAHRLLRHGMATASAVSVPLLVLVAAAATTRGAWLPFLAGDAAIAVALILFLIAIFGGLPVGFGLLLATTSYLWLSDTVPLIALPQNMVDGTGNFVLLALPFFVLAGLIMERGGISLRLVRFVRALVGHLRGGLLQVMVVSMYLVSGLSGSKTADVAAVGSVMRDMLERERYGISEGAAVLAASAAMGETVPPSIAMLVLGSITTISVGALFIGGLIPAAVIAVCLMVLILVRARRSMALREARAPLSVVLPATAGAILPLAMPVLLFAGILLGVATPTEVSSFAVVYGLVLAFAVYREFNLRIFVRTVIDGAVLSGMVLFILAAASGFSWALTVANLPQRLVELLNGIDNSTVLFLLGSMILLIVIGSLLEGLPALIILAPLLLPIAGQIGLSELHFGIVLLVAMGIGAFLPPVGVGFYVACAIMRTDIERASRAMIPYLLVLIVGLLLVAFVPWFTLFLPRAVGFAG